MTAQARYDQVADFYVAGFDVVDDPPSLALLDLLDPVDGVRVLDVACGHGRITRELKRRGADVTGIDISAVLIERARRAAESQPDGITYIHADVASAQWQPESGYDAVSCHFGFSDIDDLDRAVAAIASALNSGGRLVFSILHPCFPGFGDASGSWPTGSRYYDEGFWTADGGQSTLRRLVGANHRMLATYVSTLRSHGLWLDELREPSPEPVWSAGRDQAASYPLYLVARCLKLPADQA